MCDYEVAYDEIAQFIAGSGGANDDSLYEDEDYDIYDTYDIGSLRKQKLAFFDMMDINLHRFASNRMSSKDVYSRKRIIAVTSLKIIRQMDSWLK
ncbi:hypothetical protein Tco_1527824, partial [Tanacetum coccineum]